MKLIESILNSFNAYGSLQSPSRPQRVTDEEVTNVIDSLAFDSGGAVSSNSGVLGTIREFYSSRNALIDEYDSLDPADALVSSVLDQYADWTVIQSGDSVGSFYSLVGGSKDARTRVENVFERNDLSNNAWLWARHLCKYGELFIVTTLHDNGHIRVTYEADPRRYIKVKVGYQIGIFDTIYGGFVDNDPTFEEESTPSEIRQRYAEEYNVKEISVRQIRLTPRNETQAEMNVQVAGNKLVPVTVLTGSSILDPVLVTLRLSRLIENTILTNRIEKSKTTRIYEVEVGDTNVSKAKEIVNNFKRLIGGREVLSTTARDFSKGNSNPVLSELIVPTKHGVGSIKVQDVASEYKVGDLGDLDYFMNRFYAGVKVPKSYLGQEEKTPGGFASDPLIKIDARFHKAIARVQQSINLAFNDVIKFDMESMLDGNYSKVEFLMNRDRSAEELREADAMSKIIRNVSDIIRAITDADESVDKSIVSQEVFKTYIPTLYSKIYEEALVNV